MKLYPKTFFDQSWVKWALDIGKEHATIRFAWRPLFILEQAMKMYWDKEGTDLVRNFFKVLNSLAEEWKSPLVVYLNEFREQTNKWVWQNEKQLKS